MRIERYFTEVGESPYRSVAFKTIDIDIPHSDATQRCCMSGIEVPAHWSYKASEALIVKFFRKSGIAEQLEKCDEADVPEWLQASRSVCGGVHGLRAEQSAKQVFHRLAGSWTYWGWKIGYFDTEDDARSFYDEMCYMLAMQIAAPHTPQWLNTGLHWAYGIEGDAQGHYHIDPLTARLKKSDNAYQHPQHHSVFLQSVRDTLVSDGGILDLWERESRAFKYGSATGSNFSAIRGAGEVLSSGERSLGLMRFLATGDKAASAVKAAGATPRSSKMVVLDIDHPDVEALVRWRVEEEQKAAALVTGSHVMRQHLCAVIKATRHGSESSRFKISDNPRLKKAMQSARQAMVPESYIQRVIDYAKQGYQDVMIPVYGTSEDSEVFYSVSAHRLQIAVRMPDAFMHAVADHKPWHLKGRKDTRSQRDIDASYLMENMAQAAWATHSPAMQFSDAIASWHTCPEEGDINCSSVDGEALFLDDTASVHGHINIHALHSIKEGFDLSGYEHAIRLNTIMLDIAVSMGQFPSRHLAMGTYSYRPLGLGLVNLSSQLVAEGIAYDSAEGRAQAAAYTAVMTGVAYTTSAEIARELGAFKAYGDHRKSMLRVIERHRALAHGERDYDSVRNPPLVRRHVPNTALADMAARMWDMAALWGDEYGYRNAQVSIMPAVRSVAQLMDAETVGVAPLRHRVRYAQQPQGKLRKHLAPSVDQGLAAAGYSAAEMRSITEQLLGRGTLADAPCINHEALRAKGFGDAQLQAIEDALPHARHMREAFDPWIVGEGFCRAQLTLGDDELFNASFDMLAHLGFDADAIDSANRYACGEPSLDAIDELQDEDRAIFRCKLSDHEDGITAEAQLRMMAAVQSFVSGGVAHCIRVPQVTTIEQCSSLMQRAWQLGLKSIAVERANSALVDSPLLGLEQEHAPKIKEEAPKTTASVTPMKQTRRAVKPQTHLGIAISPATAAELHAPAPETESEVDNVVNVREPFTDIEGCLEAINRLSRAALTECEET